MPTIRDRAKPVLAKRPALAGSIVLAISVMAGGSGLLMAAMSGMPSSHRLQPQSPEAPCPTAQSILPLLSLDNTALAAANVSASDIALVKEAVGTRLTSDWSSLRTLISARDIARARAAKPPTANTNGEVPTVTQLRQAASDAQAAVGAWLDNARQAAIADLPAEQRAILNQIYANRHSALPIEFRIASYDQAELIKLRDALSQRVRALQLGESLGADAADLIGRYETTAVLAARSRIELAGGQ